VNVSSLGVVLWRVAPLAVRLMWGHDEILCGLRCGAG